LRFLVDAQLPPGLAVHLAAKGHAAEHVHDVGLGGAPDRKVWNYAARHRAVLITKDADFAEIARTSRRGTAVVWVRLGNTTNRALWRTLEPLLSEIVEALQSGERLIEIL
jgi:predicted nuclease of predicted toxin-antitoxin system